MGIYPRAAWGRPFSRGDRPCEGELCSACAAFSRGRMGPSCCPGSPWLLPVALTPCPGTGQHGLVRKRRMENAWVVGDSLQGRASVLSSWALSPQDQGCHGQDGPRGSGCKSFVCSLAREKRHCSAGGLRGGDTEN